MKKFNILDYIQEAEALEKLYSNFLNLCEEHKDGYRYYQSLTVQARPIQRELLRRYEIWFAVTKLIVRQHSDKYNVFEFNYAYVKKDNFYGILKFNLIEMI